MTREQRFWAKVEKRQSGCWEWTAAKFKGPHGGYGCFAPLDGRNAMAAHRFAWELLRGPIPPGKLLHHICRNRACVNPEHLLLTKDYADHMRHHRKTHCYKGHPLAEKNGQQFCPRCAREWMARNRAAKREQRGYGKYEGLRGSHNQRSKLTEDDVLYIRRIRGQVMGKDLASRFGVSAATISNIQHPERDREWSWLKEIG